MLRFEPSMLRFEPSMLHFEPSMLHFEPSMLHFEPSMLRFEASMLRFEAPAPGRVLLGRGEPHPKLALLLGAESGSFGTFAGLGTHLVNLPFLASISH
jgi:hypothetical protein